MVVWRRGRNHPYREAPVSCEFRITPPAAARRELAQGTEFICRIYIWGRQRLPDDARLVDDLLIAEHGGEIVRDPARTSVFDLEEVGWVAATEGVVEPGADTISDYPISDRDVSCASRVF